MSISQKEKLVELLNRRGMYGIESDIKKTIGFLIGFDAAHGGEILFGFREWYLNEYFNAPEPFGWPSLVENKLRELDISDQEKVDLLVKDILEFFDGL